MKREIHFIPSAEVCSKEILIELEDDRIIRCVLPEDATETHRE